MEKIKSLWDQGMCIPKPQFGEASIDDQSGRVIIVTGGYAGIGYQLCKILYRKNATVYMAGRSKDKYEEAAEKLRTEVPESQGNLSFLQLDLARLDTIKASAEEFLAKEKRLDVLVNNAGVMLPPDGSKTDAGYELQIATNGLGPFLFTHHLFPILCSTAASSPPSSVRVTWAASLAIDLLASDAGMEFDENGDPKNFASNKNNYGQSKVANLFLAVEFAKRCEKHGILSISWNPGNIQTDLYRHMSGVGAVVSKFTLFPPSLGVIPPLYAGWSPAVTMQDCLAGELIIPWDRKHTPRPKLLEGIKPKSEGGQGLAEQFWEWCKLQTKVTEIL
ncbi:short-chain dehydrogenase [Diplodia corticola]|uniref:Short-chain dehydrogenase n=1 Tax=Diplodia corticola TaxID=236234 RepID=A0A1J9S294_9PEZI|nr:short-chain dehydrogenase [Diplodia corticola]OJD33765.1 short-chain dehydrogenase [Diplodia corticola]